MKKVAVNDFVLRQVKGSGKTYSDHLSFDEIAIDAERQMAKGLIKKGYRAVSYTHLTLPTKA